MKVLVVSESFIIRDSLTDFFKEEFAAKDVKTFYSLDCLSTEDFIRCNFLFIDTNISKDNIVEVLKNIKNKYKKLKVMILDNKKDIDLFSKTLNYGIDGYILNITDKDEFIYIIKKVINGKKFYDSELLQYSTKKEKNDSEINLTNKEKSVLNYVCKGFSNKEIADELKVTDYTIKKHVSNILSKLNLKTRQEIIIHAKDKCILN